MSNQEHILIVDDEANIRLTLSALLEDEGYAVTTAASGEAALAVLDTQPFDLLLVDLRLPGIDGMQVVAGARERGIDSAVIVLTGHGSVETAVEGMHQGVFDYLLKTSTPQTVLERVRAGLAQRAEQQRRDQLLDMVSSAVQELRGEPGQSKTAAATPAGAPSGPATPKRVMRFGDLELDTWRQQASLDKRSLPLTPTEFRVLLCLAEHAGRVRSYRELVRCAQGYDTSDLEASELIKPHIHHLRQKLEADPSNPRYLLNVRGTGYLLATPNE
jgi:DNA-binding response OmpR family regulator